jgi:hypothetical protein
MNPISIWTLPSLSFRERLSRTVEWALFRTAHHLPRRLAYWSYIDTSIRYVKDDEEVPAVPFAVILDRAGAALG